MSRISARTVPFADNVVVLAPGDLDDRIDDLYRGSLDAFTSARNALAKTLSGDDAARVRALKKPSVVAWAVNQVYWHARPAYERAIDSGQRLRKAQIAALKGRSADLRAATDEHRRAIAETVQEATQLASASGSRPTPDALMRTFEALSLAATPPETPGRLTSPLQPAGFEALAGVTPVAGGRHALKGPAKAGRHDASRAPALDAARAEREAARLTAAEKKQHEAEEKQRQAHEQRRKLELGKAEAAVERARAAEALARERYDRAQRDVRAAEQRLHELKSGT